MRFCRQQVIAELNLIVKDIERSEKLIVTLNQELQAINAKFQGPRDTRADVAYLTGLLECAKRKLAWEKQISSLQKRTPSIMERMGTLLNDPKSPPSSEVRDQLLRALQSFKRPWNDCSRLTPEQVEPRRPATNNPQPPERSRKREHIPLTYAFGPQGTAPSISTNGRLARRSCSGLKLKRATLSLGCKSTARSSGSPTSLPSITISVQSLSAVPPSEWCLWWKIRMPCSREPFRRCKGRLAHCGPTLRLARRPRRRSLRPPLGDW